MRDVRGVPAVLITVLLAIVTRALVNVDVPLWIPAVVIVLLVLVIAALADALYKAVALAKAPRTIEVINCVRPCPPYEDAYAIFIVRAPDGLSTNSSLAFHIARGEFHEPLGFGTVQHDQDHETYQVTLDRLLGNTNVEDLFDKNKTKASEFSVRHEFSLTAASRSRTPVAKSTGVLAATAVTTNTADPQSITYLPPPSED